MYRLEINRSANEQPKWEDDCLGDNTSEIKGKLETMIPELARICDCPESDFRVVELV